MDAAKISSALSTKKICVLMRTVAIVILYRCALLQLQTVDCSNVKTAQGF